MKTYSRQERVAGLIQRALSEVLLKEVKDPRLEGTAITGVSMSGDLRIANIYYVVSGSPPDVPSAAAGFQSALGYVKRHLSNTLELRYMPILRFHYDQSFDYAERIDQLLDQINDGRERPEP